jgi:hypothetical protein
MELISSTGLSLLKMPYSPLGCIKGISGPKIKNWCLEQSEKPA